MDTWLEDLTTRFGRLFGATPKPGLAVAPGRVNLIGEHTDYNDGFVLPMAIDRAVGVVFRKRDDSAIRGHAIAFGETRTIAVEDVTPHLKAGWFSYVAGVARAMIDAGMDITGADMVIGGNVPIGAGLSSSAALEMAVARALCAASEITWSAPELARVGQSAEQRYVGVNCGIMDQVAAAQSEEGSAILLDCRSLEAQQIPIPPDIAIVIMDTGVRRSLARSVYNDRRASCLEAVAALQPLRADIRALRDVDQSLLQQGRELMSEETYHRACHVVDENARPAALAKAFAARDFTTAGDLMRASHASLRDLYVVSCPELDCVVDLAGRHPSCYGSRMTGAGFGGCAVALVPAKHAQSFLADIKQAYDACTGLEGSFFVAKPSGGARLP